MTTHQRDLLQRNETQVPFRYQPHPPARAV